MVTCESRAVGNNTRARTSRRSRSGTRSRLKPSRWTMSKTKNTTGISRSAAAMSAGSWRFIRCWSSSNDGLPLGSMATISPSRAAFAAGCKRRDETIPGYPAVMSCPPRDRSSTAAPSRYAMARMPSSFGSNEYPESAGIGAAAASMGPMWASSAGRTSGRLAGLKDQSLVGPEMAPPAARRSASVLPDTTERSSSSRLSASWMAASRCFSISHWLPSSFVRTSAHEPLSFFPLKVSDTFPEAISRRSWASAPARSPQNTWPLSSGENVPASQMRLGPAPYSPFGMTPSKPAYSSGWSSVRAAKRRSAGSADGPFGKAQHFSPPSSSRRMS